MTNPTVNPVPVGDVTFGSGDLPPIIAGPCVIESESHALDMAAMLKELVQNAGFSYVFKSSYDKANRSSIYSFRGPGIDKGLEILGKVRSKIGVPVLTDIHAVDQIARAANVVSMIQIPAFLFRHTDLYIEAGKHDIAVNVKKGQFMSPESMGHIVDKARECGIERLTLTERGASFGYHRLVVDFTGMEIMKRFGAPLVFDGTHAVQQPAGSGSHSGGNRDFVPGLCRAAAALGVHGFFLEVHDSPDDAPCDGPNMISPQTLIKLLKDIRAIVTGLKGNIDDRA